MIPNAVFWQLMDRDTGIRITHASIPLLCATFYPDTTVSGFCVGCTKDNPRLCRGNKRALAENKEIKRIPQQCRSGLPTTHLQQRGIPTDNLGQYRLQKCQNRKIHCPFRGGRAVNADVRNSVHLQMPASKKPFQGLIKPPAQPEVLTIKHNWKSFCKDP